MVKSLVKAVLTTSLPWKAAHLVNPSRGVCVLMYHRIVRPGSAFDGAELDAFWQQMRWLQRNCRLLHADEFEDALEKPSVRPAVLVTFDDGYRDYHDLAYPILEDLRIPALVFLATAYIDAGGMIWTDAIRWAFGSTDRQEAFLPWSSDRLPLVTHPDRLRATEESKRFLKSVPNAQRLEWMGALFGHLGVDPSRDEHRHMLSWDEVRATLPLTCYGGHTHTHPILSQIPPSVGLMEIRTCRERIEAETSCAPRYFAYPNGRECDFTAHNRAVLREQGFELAFSTIEGVHRKGMDRYAIRRQPTGCRSLGDFAWLVAGL